VLRRRRRRLESDGSPDEDVLEVVARALNEREGSWRVDGDLVRSQGSVTVLTTPPDHDLGPAKHFHLGLALNPDDSEAPVVWDCTAGGGAADAIASWVDTTAVTVLELVSQRGDLATHLGSDDPLGFLGWHAIHGAIVGRGNEEFRSELAGWWVDRPVLPELRESLLSELDRPVCNGVKLLVGSFGDHDVVEVTVNGRAAPAATSALSTLDWPRCRPPARGAYVKTFVLLVHPTDDAGSADPPLGT